MSGEGVVYNDSGWGEVPPRVPKRHYSRTAFWLVKVLMLVVFLMWYANFHREAGRQEALKMKLVQRIISDQSYCYNGTFWPITEFDTKKLRFRVKKEAVQ